MREAAMMEERFPLALLCVLLIFMPDKRNGGDSHAQNDR